MITLSDSAAGNKIMSTAKLTTAMINALKMVARVPGASSYRLSYLSYDALKNRGLIAPQKINANETRWSLTTAGYQYASEQGWLIEYEAYAASIGFSAIKLAQVVDQEIQAGLDREALAISQQERSATPEYHYSSFNRPVLDAYPPFGFLRCETSAEHPYGVLVYSTKLVQAAMNQYELYPVSDNAYAYPVGALVWYEGIDKCRVTEHVGRGRYMLELVDDASLGHEYVSPKSLQMYTDLTPTYPVKDDDYAYDPIDAPEMMSEELDPSEIETPDPCPKCGSPLSYYSMVRFIECTNRQCGWNSNQPTIENQQEQTMSTEPEFDIDNLSDAEEAGLKALAANPDFWAFKAINAAAVRPLSRRGFVKFNPQADRFEITQDGRNYLRSLELMPRNIATPADTTTTKIDTMQYWYLLNEMDIRVLSHAEDEITRQWFLKATDKIRELLTTLNS